MKDQEHAAADMATNCRSLTIRDVDGWSVGFRDGDSEPRMRDVDLGTRLRFTRPRDVRALIERLVAAGKLNDVHHCDTVSRRPGQVAARPVREYWLTEAQALKVAARSETDVADALLDEMIRVYMLARRGLLPAQQGGLDAAAVVQIVAQATGPLAEQLRDLKTALTQRAEGMISAHQAVELGRQIGIVARTLVDLGDYKNMKAARAAVHQQVMAAAEWGGTGRARWAMPASRYAAAMAALRALLRLAERRQRCARRPPQPKRGQLDLKLDKPN